MKPVFPVHIFTDVRASHNEKNWFNPTVITCGIYGGRSGSGTVSSLSTSIFPCHYHSTNASYSFITDAIPYWKNDSSVKYHTQLCLSIINSLFRKASFTQFCRVEPKIFLSSELQKISARPPPWYSTF